MNIMGYIFREYPDRLIIISTMLLMMIGIVFVYSVSGPYVQFLNESQPTWYFLYRQSLWTIIALIILFFVYRLDYEIIVKFSPLLMIFALVALLAVLIISKADIKRWINIGPISFQPSEFFKLAAVAFLARIAARKVANFDGYRKLFPTIALVLLGIMLVIKEPDLGTSSLIFGIMVALLFLSGFPSKYIMAMGAAALVVFSLLVFVMGYEKDRVDQYLITVKDPFNSAASYQTRQALVSFGSGGLLGKGLGNGGQKHLFLPARHTDFILASAAEEGGFAIVAAILSLFAVVGLSGYRIATAAADIQGAMLAWGMLLSILIQATLNIGVALGLFPITGVTLPFISYGGSSLVMSCMSIGILASVARRSRSPRKYFRRFRGE